MLIFLKTINLNMKKILIGLTVLCASYGFAQSSEKTEVILDEDTQVKLATHFLSADEKKQAKVLGYSPKGELIVLKDANGHLTCLADDPSKKGVELVCYHNKLDAFMQRGRDLRNEGKSTKELRAIRKAEIESGELEYPKEQSMLYVFKGDTKNIDLETGTVKNGNLRYVVYVPYGTQETTGLPLSPAQPGMPWLMDPGTHRAHIMITPK